MRVIHLTAENVKRLRAVDITPAHHVQVVTGRNAQGKTSVLDALWLALGGGTAKKANPRPVRDGAERARVCVDLGDLVVTRSWTDDDHSSLTVSSPDGATYGSPQKMLDALVGRISFDPLAFMNLDAKAQRQQLLELVDLPFDADALDADRRDIYDRRTDVGRNLRAAQANLAAMPEPPEGTPDVEQSPSELVAELAAATGRNSAADRAQADLDRTNERMWALDRQIADLQAERDKLHQQSARLNDEVAGLKRVDTAPIEERLLALDGINAQVRAKRERDRVSWLVADLEAEQKEMTESIDTIDKRKADGLAAATMPVDGLGFDEDGVTFQGQPLVQASAAEKIRVSLGIAMALNPTLRVIRILDGSLLDSENMALIADMARDRDYQVWIERIKNSSETAVVIEDGQVAQ